MADGLTVTVVSDQIRAGLGELQARFGDLQPLFIEIGEQLESRVQTRFDTKRDPLGAQWKPWEESTRDAYDRADTVIGRGGEAEIKRKGTLLERSGHMRDGLSYVASAIALELGFDREYAIYHETGTEKMHRRGLLLGDAEAGTLSAPDEDLVMTIIGHWLNA
ncbi:phage virion morphogenesis protein [Rhodocyclus tenuis]|uniref:Phage gpG-like protein n=1 Tax=Rhodocyclus tenuis TaxID=1066 RepID=A0A840G5S1_RHOTE|nr:phage virion morphogenesis protein [Rhodocyclus tenuis]MBB4247256.1 phage gpG-like protein [Rhodocyclus tenuis]